MKKYSIFAVFFALILCGCGRKDTSVQPQIVTRIDIFSQEEKLDITRQYTNSEKIEAVLLYLRLLKVGRKPAGVSESNGEDLYEIKLYMWDGTIHLLKQKDHKFFWKPNTGWRDIPPEQASGLYTLMRRYQSDL